MAIYHQILEYKLPYTEEESKDWSFNELSRIMMNRYLNRDFTLLFQHFGVKLSWDPQLS